jgi:hypothetical protein
MIISLPLNWHVISETNSLLYPCQDAATYDILAPEMASNLRWSHYVVSMFAVFYTSLFSQVRCFFLFYGFTCNCRMCIAEMFACWFSSHFSLYGFVSLKGSLRLFLYFHGMLGVWTIPMQVFCFFCLIFDVYLLILIVLKM